MTSLTAAALLLAAAALVLAAVLAFTRARTRRGARELVQAQGETQQIELDRRAELERAMARLENELVAVYGEMARVAGSRSWRYSHSLSTLLSTLVGRRPAARESAVDTVLDRLERVELPSDGAPLKSRFGAEEPRRRALARRSPRRARGASPAVPKPPGLEIELLVAALGFSEAELERTVEALAHRPPPARSGMLVLVDADIFASLRQSELRFEFVPPEADWDRHFPGESYERFLGGRIAEMVDAYAPGRTLVLGGFSEVVLGALAGPAGRFEPTVVPGGPRAGGSAADRSERAGGRPPG